MFLGHFAMAFAAKAAAPKANLGATVFAAQAADLLWPTLLLLGIERARIQEGITRVMPLDLEYYPFSHSLLSMAALGVLIGGGYWLLRRDGRGAVALGLAVLSHWVLDAASHRPDMPLAPGADLRVGLGLWDSVPGTVATELLLLTAGLGLYLWRTSARDGIGQWALWAFVAFLCAGFAGNIAGTQPPDMQTVAIVGQSAWLLVAWAWWIDRHRDVRP